MARKKETPQEAAERSLQIAELFKERAAVLFEIARLDKELAERKAMAKKKKKPVKKVKKKKYCWRVFAAYPATLYFSLGLDREIERAARRERDGSGMGFGQRDMDFSFSTRILAMNATKRIRKVHKDIEIRMEKEVVA